VHAFEHDALGVANLDPDLAAEDGQIPNLDVVGGDDDAPADDRAGLADQPLRVVEHERALVNSGREVDRRRTNRPSRAAHDEHRRRCQRREAVAGPSELTTVFRVGEPEERQNGVAERLRELSEPSYPPGRAWDEPLERATREGRFRVSPELNGARQVICATGFRRGFQHDLLLRRLANEYELQTVERWLVLAPDATVPVLTDANRTLALAGVPAQWAYPAADTLAGMKYVARRFLRRIQRCPTR